MIQIPSWNSLSRVRLRRMQRMMFGLGSIPCSRTSFGWRSPVKCLNETFFFFAGGDYSIWSVKCNGLRTPVTKHDPDCVRPQIWKGAPWEKDPLLFISTCIYFGISFNDNKNNYITIVASVSASWHVLS